MEDTRPRVSMHRLESLCHQAFSGSQAPALKSWSLVPKLLLGNPLWRNAPFCEIIRWVSIILLTPLEVPKQSLGQIYIPKRGLGNEK